MFSAKKYMRTVIRNMIKLRSKNPDDVQEKLFIDSLITNDQIDKEEVF